MREALGVSPDVRFEYRGEDGKAMSAEAFASKMTSPGFMAVPDKSHPGKVVLTLKRVEAEVAGPSRLPPFDLADLSGRRVRNADLAGKPALLSFYFSTCLPCIKEVPALNAYRKAHPELNYLAITFDSAAEARKFVADRKLTWPVIADARKFVDATSVHGYPTYVLVSPDGRILGRQSGLTFEVGEQTPGMARLEKFIAGLLKR